MFIRRRANSSRVADQLPRHIIAGAVCRHSQPPGIAITDPDRIVRALDVFILMANFNLLLANFIGAGAAVWLSMQALKARHKFAVGLG
ncbi:MAG: DUF3611 family protein [Methylocystis sp.]|nr:DUF3611 family protein [Methylocystis sp.]MBI5312131.1 DUF3611 family protein [Methylocystis sp.]